MQKDSVHVIDCFALQYLTLAFIALPGYPFLCASTAAVAFSLMTEHAWKCHIVRSSLPGLSTIQAAKQPLLQP